MKMHMRFVLVLLLLTAPAFIVAGTNEEGLAFLEDNKAKEGVVVLPSGLQYKILQKGSGAHRPTVSSPCLCHYEGKLISGDVFDSSYERGSPTTFAPNQVIKGWTEIMQLMVEGDKFEVYIPSELAYGDGGSPPKIPGGSVLIFTMEIIEIQGDKVDALKCNPTTKEDCNEKETAYIEKMLAKEKEAMEKEYERLKGMVNDKMKPELQAWISRRIHILKQLVEPKVNQEEL
jgi:FKBP-type peptidyl-prolyl cis-trans isomerase FklB